MFPLTKILSTVSFSAKETNIQVFNPEKEKGLVQ